MAEGALTLSGWNVDTGSIGNAYFNALSKKYNFSLNTPLNKLSRKIVDILLYGNNNEKTYAKI